MTVKDDNEKYYQDLVAYRHREKTRKDSPKPEVDPKKGQCKLVSDSPLYNINKYRG